MRSSFGSDAAAVLRQYPLSQYAVPGSALAAVTTDSGFTCPELDNATSIARHGPTWAYEFRDTSAPLRPYELVPPSFSLATQHSAELPYLWGSTTMTPLTADQQQLADQMITYWRHFAAVGDLRTATFPT